MFSLTSSLILDHIEVNETNSRRKNMSAHPCTKSFHDTNNLTPAQLLNTWDNALKIMQYVVVRLGSVISAIIREAFGVEDWRLHTVPCV